MGSAMFNMDKSKKLLLIKQWFLTKPKKIKSFDDASKNMSKRQKKKKKKLKPSMLALSKTSDLGAFAESDSEDMPFNECLIDDTMPNKKKNGLRMRRSKSVNESESKVKSKNSVSVKSKKKRTKSKVNIVGMEKKNKIKENDSKGLKKKDNSDGNLEISLKSQSKHIGRPKLKGYSKSLSLLFKRKMAHTHDEKYYF